MTQALKETFFFFLIITPSLKDITYDSTNSPEKRL